MWTVNIGACGNEGMNPWGESPFLWELWLLPVWAALKLCGRKPRKKFTRKSPPISGPETCQKEWKCSKIIRNMGLVSHMTWSDAGRRDCPVAISREGWYRSKGRGGAFCFRSRSVLELPRRLRLILQWGPPRGRKHCRVPSCRSVLDTADPRRVNSHNVHSTVPLRDALVSSCPHNSHL